MQRVVLQWYYNRRDNDDVVIPDLNAVFGPFENHVEAEKWIKTATTWGGWGEYKYVIKELDKPTENTENL